MREWVGIASAQEAQAIHTFKFVDASGKSMETPVKQLQCSYILLATTDRLLLLIAADVILQFGNRYGQKDHEYGDEDQHSHENIAIFSFSDARAVAAGAHELAISP
jgi:hypothetical protein